MQVEMTEQLPVQNAWENALQLPGQNEDVMFG